MINIKSWTKERIRKKDVIRMGIDRLIAPSFKFILILIGFIIIISACVSAEYTYTNSFSGFGTGYSSASYQYQPSFQTYYGSSMSAYWPILTDSQTCNGRQDIILQTAPGGCQPMVVTSDLIADQNVPVFCQIDAMQLNPLIDIKAIRNIQFTGNYPKEVANVGFHPARAALNTRDRLMGNPVINNIGYAVVVLKRTPNESALPDSVTVKLTGKIEYDAGNAYGIGTNVFYLSPTNEQDWALQRDKNSFWNGKYYVRVEDADTDFALISLYDGVNKIATRKVKLGQSSEPIFLPGIFCQFGLVLTYNKYDSADTKARIEISDDKGTDVIDVYKGTPFLNGKCSVREIYVNSNGQTGSVRVVCGSDSFILQRSSVINVEGLQDGKVSHSYSDKDEICGVDFADGSGYQIKRAYDSSKKVSLIGDWTAPEGVKGTDASKLDSAKSASIRNNLIKACELKDDGLSPEDAETALKDATLSYQSVADNYPNEAVTSGTGSGTYGLKALQATLELIKMIKEKGYSRVETEGIVLNKIIQLYPEIAYSYKSQLDDAFSVDSLTSMKTILIDNKFRTIRLVSVETPQEQEKATIKASLGGRLISNWRINDSQSVSGWSNVAINLTSFSARSAVFTTNCPTEGVSSYNSNRARSEQANKPTSKHTITVNFGESMMVCGQTLTYLDNDLKKVAQITIAPNAYGPETETNFTIKIGIEKRAISLSPDEAKEKIKSLNESIKKWESISANLVKLETTLKGACFATAAALTVKNFFSSMSGTGAARQEVMSGDKGWNKRCEEAVKTGKLDTKGNGEASSFVAKQYSSITQCIFDNSKNIEAEVNAVANGYKGANDGVKEIDRIASAGNNGVVNQDMARDELLKKINSECPTVKDTKYSDIDSYRIKRDASTETKTATSTGEYYYPYTYSELVDYYKNCKVYNSGYSTLTATEAMKSTYDRAKQNAKDYETYTKTVASGDLMKYAIGSSDSNSVKSGTMMEVKDGKIKGASARCGDTTGADCLAGFDSAFLLRGQKVIQKDTNGREQTLYKDVLVVGNNAGTSEAFNPKKAYVYEWHSDWVSPVDLIPLEEFSPGVYSVGGVTTFYGQNGISQLKSMGEGLFGNVIRQADRKVLYFASGSDKDLPSQVPFDVSNGWYAKIEPASLTLGSTTVAAYDSSGMPKRWKICNVGDDGMISINDQCQEVIQGSSTSATILGLDEKTSKDLVLKSQRAILDAGSQKGSARKTVNILGQQMDVDYTDPASNVQCSNFMSPADCKLLYNVCDPVICPPSRCDFGGTYRVSNVQQTGIVGGVLLCAPNVKEGIYLPVCVSGIRNGIDAFVSLLKQHRDCLEKNVQDGSLVGVCDELTSIYMCEFFWRQAAPLMNMLLPKAIEMMYSGSTGATKGGGEYLFVQKAWDNAKAGMDYFTNYYAENTMKAFQIRSIEEAGTEICKGFISLSVPTSFKALLEPDSPPQFTARFDETTYSTVTVPATSKYKVFYFINAGKDSGVYYSVYLKNPPESGYYYSTQQIMVASGFIGKGQSASETKDFTAPQGYKELCVRVNDQEQCGFKQVSTDFAVNYLRDKYAEEELTKTDIKTAAGCTSGTASLLALTANLNLQSAAEEAAMANIAQRGITRICATQNPGGTTNPTKYVDVGYCGDTNTRCWLDKNSISNAITDSNLGVKNETLSQLEQLTIQQLMAKDSSILSSDAAVEKLKEIENKVDTFCGSVSVKGLTNGGALRKQADSLIMEINSLSSKLVYNNHKAWLAYELGRVKDAKFRTYFYTANGITAKVNAVGKTGCEKYADIEGADVVSYEGEDAEDGDYATTIGTNKYSYNINSEKLYWLNGKGEWEPVGKGTDNYNLLSPLEKEWKDCLATKMKADANADYDAWDEEWNGEAAITYDALKPAVSTDSDSVQHISITPISGSTSYSSIELFYIESDGAIHPSDDSKYGSVTAEYGQIGKISNGVMQFDSPQSVQNYIANMLSPNKVSDSTMSTFYNKLETEPVNSLNRLSISGQTSNSKASGYSLPTGDFSQYNDFFGATYKIPLLYNGKETGLLLYLPDNTIKLKSSWYSTNPLVGSISNSGKITIVNRYGAISNNIYDDLNGAILDTNTRQITLSSK